MRTVLLNTLEWFGGANDRQRLLGDKQKRLKVGKANVTVAATMEIIRPVCDSCRSSRNSSTLCKVHTKLLRNVFKLIFVRENAWTARHQTVSDHSFSVPSPFLAAVYVCSRLFVCSLHRCRRCCALSSTHCRKFTVKGHHLRRHARLCVVSSF